MTFLFLLLILSFSGFAQESQMAIIQCDSPTGLFMIQLPELNVILADVEINNAQTICGVPKDQSCRNATFDQRREYWGNLVCNDARASFVIDLNRNVGSFTCDAHSGTKKMGMKLKNCVPHWE